VSRVDGRTQKERLEAGELYAADDPVLQDGSVVTRDLPAGVLAVGSPARVVRELR
jgi:serine acetyltransferase